jgi:ribosomal-protein-alanine N-acetyltransferase
MMLSYPSAQLIRITRASHPQEEVNVLTTERLILREVPLTEVLAILDGQPVEGANWAVGYPFDGTMSGAKLVRRMVETGTYRPGFGIYQIALRETGCVVGDIGFHAAPDENGSVEIGYGLVEAYRHQGIATEATQALVSWALNQAGITEVRAETDKGHAASQRVLVKTGFHEVGSGGDTDRFALRRAPWAVRRGPCAVTEQTSF